MISCDRSALTIDGGYGQLALSNLKPFHVSEWLRTTYSKQKNGKPNSASYRNGAIRSVMRVFNWAAKEGCIPANPVRGVERPKPGHRKVFYTPGQWQAIMDAFPDDHPFREFLTILRETGCRPQEARLVECRHFKPALDAWVFPVEESKAGERTGEERIVTLNNAALAMTKRAVLRAGGEGRLFVNKYGRPWSKSMITGCFNWVSGKVGFRVFAYGVRHTWITTALMNGCDPASVATAAGHDIQMTLRIYNQLKHNRDHIRKTVAIATGETPPSSKAATA